MNKPLPKLAALATLSTLFGLLASTTDSMQAQTLQASRIQVLPAPEVTHLGIEVGRLVVLQSSQVHSQASSPLYYDGYWNAPFSVPPGYAFVATDLTLHPLVGSTEPFVNGSMNLDGFLRYPLQHVGRGMTSVSFGAGLVIRPGNTPQVSAYSNSASTFEVTITGYFVQGVPRAAGIPFQG